MFEKMWYTFIIILIILNGSFIAMSYIPVDGAGSRTLGDVWGIQTVADMNAVNNIFGDYTSGTTLPDTNVTAGLATSENIDIFRSLLFGAGAFVGGALALISFMIQALFGYFYWIDFLLNPLWHPLVGAMNVMLKTVFFIIEVVGIVTFTKEFFLFR